MPVVYIARYFDLSKLYPPSCVFKMRSPYLQENCTDIVHGNLDPGPTPPAARGEQSIKNFIFSSLKFSPVQDSKYSVIFNSMNTAIGF